MTLEKRNILKSRDCLDQFISEMHRLLPDRTGALRVLEAGCGSTSHITLDPSWHITGIDISERQLERNSRINERIHGDLEKHRWPNGAFDLIVCWDVIEHLPNPNQALANMFEALAPQGILALAFPNLHSIKGWTTKLTPYQFHLFFYKKILQADPSFTDENVFPTYLRRQIAPKHIVEFAHQHGVETCFRLEYQGAVQEHLRKSRKPANAFFSLISPLGLNNSDALLILRKTQ